MFIKSNKALFLTISLCVLALVLTATLPKKPKTGLLWSDDFDGDKLDRRNWKVYVGNGCPELCGFGNHELQYYTDEPDNIKLKDGKLLITALKQSKGLNHYTSAKILTKGRRSWKYGRIEVSARLPEGRGTWPAIWMLPERSKYGGWPSSGEIDIMEHVGYKQGKIYGTIHTESFNHMYNTQKSDSVMLTDASEAFHEYAIEWREDRIDWFIDGEKYFTFNNSGKNSDDWPFDRSFHLILNVAVGGDWGGKEGIDDSIWPQSMEIDYVRVYGLD